MGHILDHPDAIMRIEETGNGKRKISIEVKRGAYVPFRSWETAYPVDLIKHVLKIKGAYAVDEIMRDEDPLYVRNCLNWNILSYVDATDFGGRKVLDFGCGSGSSTMVLGRMLPERTLITGVELTPEYLELARHRARYYGIDGRVDFYLSSDPNNLPPEMGLFDFIVLSAVYEHLLPVERQSLLPLLWRHLNPGGILFLDQTPYRWSFLETHTTGLPLINYLPDRLAHWTICRLSRRINPDETWLGLLRKGIRGGSIREILGILNQHNRHAEILRPLRQGVRDHIDLWFYLSSTTRYPLIKTLMKWGFRTVKAVSGITMIPSLSLAIRKIR